MLEQAKRAPVTVTNNWEAVGAVRITGFEIHEVKNVIFRNGMLTELYRFEWFDPPLMVRHAVHVSMLPGAVTSWHCHKKQRDIIFPVQGQFKMGFYDDRPDSPTYRASCVVDSGIARPSYYLVPPGVWHAFRNPTRETNAYVVLTDEPFVHDDPDDWILPVGADVIPCKLD